MFRNGEDMGHQIEVAADGRAAFIAARDDAWHKLGTTVLGEAFTAEEAMRLGHLGGWCVRKEPVGFLNDLDQFVEVEDKFVTVRTNPFTYEDEGLGVVGTDYTPFQNEASADFLNTLADVSGAVFDTAGSLKGGRQTFITMRLPETLMIAGTDELDLNIAALNSHDGSSAFRLLVTPVRIVCANTQAAALRHHKASHTIRHTANGLNHVQAAREALGLTFAYVEEFEKEAERLLNFPMLDAEFERFIESLYGEFDENGSTRGKNAHKARTEALNGLYYSADTNENIRGTRWGAYQAVTEYIDHYAPVRGRGDVAARRAERLLTSDAQTRTKERAWGLLVPSV